MILCDFIFKDNIYIFNVFVIKLPIKFWLVSISRTFRLGTIHFFFQLWSRHWRTCKKYSVNRDSYESKMASYTFLAWQKQYTKYVLYTYKITHFNYFVFCKKIIKICTIRRPTPFEFYHVPGSNDFPYKSRRMIKFIHCFKFTLHVIWLVLATFDHFSILISTLGKTLTQN